MNMDLSVSWLCVAALTFFCVKNIICPFLHKNRYEIWSPITFISLTFLYYCVIPNFEGITSYYGHQLSDKKWLFNLCALVSYLIICYARLRARIQTLLRGHKYALFIFQRAVFWLGICFIPFYVCYGMLCPGSRFYAFYCV